VSTFDRIYDETMDRRSAEKFYRFNGYFSERAEALLGDLAITTSPDQWMAYSYRANSASSTASTPTASRRHHRGRSAPLRQSLLKRDLIRELKRRGCRWYLLGGGASSGDGIEKYKRQFARTASIRRAIGCRVFDSGAVRPAESRDDRRGAAGQRAAIPVLRPLINEKSRSPRRTSGGNPAMRQSVRAGGFSSPQ